MIRPGSLAALLAVVLACADATTVAAPIAYTEAVVGSGQLGTSAFTNALVTLTAFADTDNIKGVDTPGPVVAADSATINVAGIGAATIPVP